MRNKIGKRLRMKTVKIVFKASDRDFIELVKAVSVYGQRMGAKYEGYELVEDKPMEKEVVKNVTSTKKPNITTKKVQSTTL